MPKAGIKFRVESQECRVGMKVGFEQFASNTHYHSSLALKKQQVVMCSLTEMAMGKTDNRKQLSTPGPREEPGV